MVNGDVVAMVMIGGQVELSDLIGSLDKTKHYAELSKKLVSDTLTNNDTHLKEVTNYAV